MGFPRPCLDCGVLTATGNRCKPHASEYQAKLDSQRKHKRKHYSKDYSKRAKQVRDSAIICWICNQPAKPDDPWTADHYFSGIPDSPLLPAHRSCNIKRGNKPPTQ